MKQEKSASQLLQEREKRINDAIALKVPDCVPMIPSFAYFPQKFGDVTCEDAWFNPDKWNEVCKRVAVEYEPDLYNFAMTMMGPVQEALGAVQWALPGRQVSCHSSHQFVEGEYLKSEEWDHFLKDPADFGFRVYTPRVYKKLEALAQLPPLNRLYTGFGDLSVIGLLNRPGFEEAGAALQLASREMAKWRDSAIKFAREMEALGFHASAGGISQAPFDMISDTLRGMRGSMLDMYRNPDKLLECCEWLLPQMIERGISSAKMSGNPRVFIALHRGSEGFMSLKQFKKFYWPTLKKLMIALVEAGLTPAPFFEGDYTSRLEYLLELPKGKVVGQFDTTDLFKAKEIIGKHMCIRGNMPVSLLQTGSPEDIRAHARKLIDVVGKDGGYIMGTRGSLDEAKPELVKVWVDFTREYGVYR